jgi:hypothetical protein
LFPGSSNYSNPYLGCHSNVVRAGFLVMEVSLYFAKVADVADINALSSLPPHLSHPASPSSSTLPSPHSTIPVPYTPCTVYLIAIQSWCQDSVIESRLQTRRPQNQSSISTREKRPSLHHSTQINYLSFT